MGNLKFVKEKDLGGIKNPIFLVSMPIAPVANVVLSSIQEQIKADFIGRFSVDDLPVVFVNKNKIEFPSIKLFHKKIGKENIVIIIGEYQPKEEAVFSVCSSVLKLFSKMKGKSIVLVDGVKIKEDSKKGKILYVSNDAISGNNLERVQTIGPLFGCTAVMLALARKAGINTTAFLTETEANDISTKDIRKNVLMLNDFLNLKINLNSFNEKIKGIEKSIRIIDVKSKADENKEKLEKEKHREYIG